ncbi:MAG TPA: putative CRISPR-associated protein [Candidatus Acidoferrales bacterium]|nr:putative CRISPR-associated protein [Candidatus Acidoferrales bacterium]
MRALLNTVGTSILSHWRGEYPELSDENRRRLVARLARLPRDERKLGAELNSIHSIAQQGEIAPGDRCYFLVSDTREGLFTGRLLNDVIDGWGYRTAKPKVIKSLQGKDPRAFERGLRKLVRVIAELYRAHKNQKEEVLLNATGGYKAQISFAGLIGQVLGIPVFYQFEDFPRAIKLPPLPISFDLDDWLTYRHIFEALEVGDDGDPLRANDSRLRTLPVKLGVLLDRSQGFVTLNALGELYHQGFRDRFAVAKSWLLPRECGIVPERKDIRHEDKNYGKHPGLREYLERIARKHYVTRIHTIRYLPEKPAEARFRPDPAAADRLKGTFWDGTVAVEFLVYLSESDAQKAKAAAADLMEDLG